MSTRASFVLICSLLLGLPAAALPRYKAVDDGKEWGSIAGAVRLDGAPPEPRTLSVTVKDKACHVDPIPDETLVVAKDGGVRWAVVSIRKISEGKAFPKGQPVPTLEQKGCRFRPHVIVVPVGQPLRITNGDGIFHNVHIYARRNRAKNIAMDGSRKELTVTFKRAERIHVKCDAHPWMSAWVVAAGHPYYAVTGANGAFELDQVPPGTYQLEAWHETLGKAEQTVTVAKGKPTQVRFQFRK